MHLRKFVFDESQIYIDKLVSDYGEYTTVMF